MTRIYQSDYNGGDKGGSQAADFYAWDKVSDNNEASGAN
jgi:hypothetical protein